MEEDIESCIKCGKEDIENEWDGDSDYICSKCRQYSADFLLDMLREERWFS